MEPTNEPSPADGDKKIEETTKLNFDKIYEEQLKREQEALESKLRGDATAKFDEVRKLGFATNKDIDAKIEGIFGKFVSEVQGLREENTKLREWVMRAKAQGLNSGAMDDKPHDENTLKAHERFHW